MEDCDQTSREFKTVSGRNSTRYKKIHKGT